jgi:hypothetical protein
LPENPSLEKSSVIAPRPSCLLIAAIAGCVVLTPLRARAQWWSRAPADFEACADKAEKAATREDRSSQLTECNAKFAGRRKPGGGYTYFDFMQNRSFDIAGPNPTPEEQKKIDEQYTRFLDQERQSRVAAEARAKSQLLQPASLRSAPGSLQSEKVPLPAVAPNKQPAANGPRPKLANCARHSFSCNWPLLSERLNDLKKLFSAMVPGRPRRRHDRFINRRRIIGPRRSLLLQPGIIARRRRHGRRRGACRRGEDPAADNRRGGNDGGCMD